MTLGNNNIPDRFEANTPGWAANTNEQQKQTESAERRAEGLTSGLMIDTVAKKKKSFSTVAKRNNFNAAEKTINIWLHL